MNYDKAYELAEEIKASPEYERFRAARAAIPEGSPCDNLLKEYKRLELRAQAASVAGENDRETLEKLAKFGELLQMDKAASEYLIAEYMLSRSLGDIYRILAGAAGLDLGPIGEN
ncbi:MAG: YlbF family regulator [Clostridia bacterium]|nr:YlbF family regulator [Clostridia bacterium]